MIFSVQLRATASNGIIMFVSNDKHSDFMALYMLNGKINFAFGSGTGTGPSAGLSLVSVSVGSGVVVKFVYLRSITKLSLFVTLFITS